MNLANWQNNAWLKRHQTNKAEVQLLLQVVQRDLGVSQDRNLNADWRFVAAYNAALQTATLALYTSGYEAAKGGGAHHYTLESLKFTLAIEDDLVQALQTFRSKRGSSIYEMVGIASETEIDELHDIGTELHARLLTWLQKNHPQLL